MLNILSAVSESFSGLLPQYILMVMEVGLRIEDGERIYWVGKAESPEYSPNTHSATLTASFTPSNSSPTTHP
jgi:hypothetical protein